MLSFKPPCRFRYRILIGCLVLASLTCGSNLLAQTDKPAPMNSANSRAEAVQNRIREELLRSKRYYPVQRVESTPTSQSRLPNTLEERIRQELLKQRRSPSNPKAGKAPPANSPSPQNVSAAKNFPPDKKTASSDRTSIQVQPTMPNSGSDVNKTRPTNFDNKAMAQDSPDSLTLNSPELVW